MKKYLLVGLVLFSNYAFALLEDEEARKKINEMQGQLNNIEKSLDKQCLLLETGLELGYKIEPKTTTMIRWLNLNEAYKQKADAINKN